MRKPVRTVVLLCAVLFSSLAGAQTERRTWRLDFYQTGGPAVEAYSFDRLVVDRDLLLGGLLATNSQ